LSGDQTRENVMRFSLVTSVNVTFSSAARGHDGQVATDRRSRAQHACMEV
jgi:hypothetical protein